MERATQRDSCMSGARMSASRPTTSTSPRNASPRSAPKGRRWHRATCPARWHAWWTPRRLLQRHDSGHGRCLGRVPGARECELRGRSRRARRVRRDDGRQRQVEAAVSQRREPGQRAWGTLPSTPRRWWRTGKSTSGRSATRSSSTASEGLQVRLVVDLCSGMLVRHEREGMAMMVLSAARAIETRLDPPIGLRRDELDGARALRKGKFTGCAVRNSHSCCSSRRRPALAACSDVSHAQTVAASPAPQEQAAPVAGAAPADDGLKDLDAMTLTCPKAGLNAAAREAAKVPSQGTYQFAYFNIIDDSHHSSYEIHFESNYEGEA